jgi:hypothetical protein
MNASDDQYRTPLPLHVAAEYGFGGASATTQALGSHDNSVSPPTVEFHTFVAPATPLIYFIPVIPLFVLNI